MGFFFRKSFRVGPFRVNVGTGGVGFSFQLFGLTFGLNSRRRPYVRFGRFGFGFYDEL